MSCYINLNNQQPFNGKDNAQVIVDLYMYRFALLNRLMLSWLIRNNLYDS